MSERLAVVEAPAPAVGRFDGRNLLTVDVEDYFHANGLRCAPETWDRLPGRVEYTTRRLLSLLAERGVHATFFVLGWVAERHPTLVREIHAAGHEVASHGYAHRLVYEQDSSAFRADVERARGLLEDLTGDEVVGYRAPSFSLRSEDRWAFATLLETGHRYDSSVFPVRGTRYGDPRAERRIHSIEVAPGQSLLEVPPSCVRLGPLNVPVAGGGYLRFFPEPVTHLAMRRLNRHDDMPAVVYVHPWEIDPDQPRMPAARLDGFRHYLNLGRTESRLERLIDTFDFAPVRALLDAPAVHRAPAVVGGAA